MPLLPYQQRVVDEKAELDTKIEALALFIGTSPNWGAVPEAEQNRMRCQHTAMVTYSIILGERIAAFPA
jgi:hypothetical protein